MRGLDRNHLQGKTQIRVIAMGHKMVCVGQLMFCGGLRHLIYASHVDHKGI